jgi:phosphatidylserine synthase
LFLVLTFYLSPEIWLALAGIILLSVAMISSVRFPKPGLKVDILTAVFIVATVLLDSVYYDIAPLLLLAALLCYILLGPMYLFVKKRSHVSETVHTRN